VFAQIVQASLHKAELQPQSVKVCDRTDISADHSKNGLVHAA